MNRSEAPPLSFSKPPPAPSVRGWCRHLLSTTRPDCFGHHLRRTPVVTRLGPTKLGCRNRPAAATTPASYLISSGLPSSLSSSSNFPTKTVYKFLISLTHAACISHVIYPWSDLQTNNLCNSTKYVALLLEPIVTPSNLGIRIIALCVTQNYWQQVGLSHLYTHGDTGISILTRSFLE